MKNVKIFIIAIFLVLGLSLGLVFTINKSKIIQSISWESFKPFSNSKYIKEIQVSFKLKENLPSIEAASAFYPLASGLVQNTFEKSMYKDELLKMVSTNEAYEDIIEGKTDIIIATEPSEYQKTLLEKSKIKINKVVLYKEPLIIYVNINNPIQNVTLDQIKRIYNDDNLNWSDYDGKKETINTYQLEENNGSQTCMQTIIGNNRVNQYHKEIKTMPAIINKVGKDKKGIGYAFKQYFTRMHINKNTKEIKVNNFDSSEREYPLLFDVFLYYNEEKINTHELVKFLNTNEGMELIKELL